MAGLHKAQTCGDLLGKAIYQCQKLLRNFSHGRSEKHRPAAVEPWRECMKKRTTLVLSLLMTASLLMTTGCGSSESTASDKTAETGAAEEKAETAESSSA